MSFNNFTKHISKEARRKIASFSLSQKRVVSGIFTSLYAASVLLLLHTAAPAIAAEKSPEPRYGGVYRRGIHQDPITLDPALAGDVSSQAIVQQLFDGLVRYDPRSAVRPAIARIWKSSRDGLTWTFNLRPGVKFHNGREVTAEDFVYSYTRIVDPRFKSPARDLFMIIKGAREFAEGKTQSIEGLKALDPYTLEITLTESFGPFVAVLGVVHAKVVPREEVEKLGENFGQQPVGTGSFKFVKWERKREMVLEANKEHFEGRPYLDAVHYRIYPGNLVDAMFEDFIGGKLEDSLVPAGKEALFKGNTKKFKLFRRSMLALRFLGINNTTPPLDNVNVRRAINHALDRQALTKKIYGDKYIPAKGILPLGTFGYNPQLKGFEYSPQKARELLTVAGYSGGKGLPKLQMWSAEKSEEILRENAVIIQNLKDIGIDAEFQYHTDWPSYNKSVYSGSYPLFRYSWIADFPEPSAFLDFLFYSKSPNNFMRYNNPRSDKALDIAKAEINDLKRADLYREAEKLILEDAPLVPLYYRTYERAFQAYVKSIDLSALGDPYNPVREIWLDKKPQLSETK